MLDKKLREKNTIIKHFNTKIINNKKNCPKRILQKNTKKKSSKKYFLEKNLRTKIINKQKKLSAKNNFSIKLLKKKHQQKKK